MSKIKLKTILGPDEDFNVPVVVKNLKGQDVEFVFTCRARTLTEWAPIQKEIAAASLESVRKQAEEAKAEAKKAKRAKKADSPDDADEPEQAQWDAVLAQVERFDQLDVVDLTNVAISKQVGFAMQIASDWDLDDPWSADSLHTFENKFPGGIQKLIDKYDASIKGAREKN